LGRTPGIPECAIAASGVRQKPNRDPSWSPEIYIAGVDDDGKRIRQTLSLGQNAVFYLRTIDELGRIDARLRISRWSGFDKAIIIKYSSFGRALKVIEDERADIPELESATNLDYNRVSL
jgi:hypothetical protein